MELTHAYRILVIGSQTYSPSSARQSLHLVTDTDAIQRERCVTRTSVPCSVQCRQLESGWRIWMNIPIVVDLSR